MEDDESLGTLPPPSTGRPGDNPFAPRWRPSLAAKTVAVLRSAALFFSARISSFRRRFVLALRRKRTAQRWSDDACGTIEGDLFRDGEGRGRGTGRERGRGGGREGGREGKEEEIRKTCARFLFAGEARRPRARLSKATSHLTPPLPLTWSPLRTCSRRQSYPIPTCGEKKLAPVVVAPAEAAAAAAATAAAPVERLVLALVLMTSRASGRRR